MKLLPDVNFDNKKENVSNFKWINSKGLLKRPLVATRKAYGEAIAEMGGKFSDIVVLDADISKSTYSCLFAGKYPKRFINVGVAEQNEMMVAAGIATTGKIPFVSTYSVFASMRACEQVRTFICYPRLNVKIAVSHGGVTPGSDGPTHQATEDMGIMRTLPNITILMPADYYSTKKLVENAYFHKGPVYIRLTRDQVPMIYNKEEDFQIGKAKILKEGSDILIIAIGDLLNQAIIACEMLEDKGISTALIDCHTLKPLDGETILKIAKNCKAVITVEDHQIQNGLGSAVCELLSEYYPIIVKRIGLKDTFARSGEYPELLKLYGMDKDSIYREAVELLKC